MRRLAPLSAILLLSACGGSGREPPDAPADAAAPAVDPAANSAAEAAPARPAAAAARWDLQASGEGSALVLLTASGGTVLRLFCPAGEGRLLVNVPAFRPVGSEERLSLGSGGSAAALVADPGGDRARGGVSGTAPVPADLSKLIAGPVSASYGAQASGPHAPPPPERARAFAAACREAPAPADKRAGSNPCETQGDGRLAVRPLRAIGTEPFWAARIQGRCVTYSHPEDQDGTRIWTRYAPGSGGTGTWTGAHQGKSFELRITAAPGCSDGMSDRRYPFAVELLVNGERRRGCAAPA